VAAWKLGAGDDVSGGDDVRSTVRVALLQMRHLSISNVVVMTSRNVTDLLLDTVSTFHLSTFKSTADAASGKRGGGCVGV